MVTLHEVITFLVSMQISISSLQTHNVNRCGRSRHMARKLSLRRKRSSPNVFEMAATETITSIILIKFGPLLEDKLCLIFKLAPSVCRMTFPILASLLVRLVVLLPFQLLRLSLATPSRWTPLALSVFLHCVVALLLTLL